MTLADYANRWLEDRRDLAERTVELYRYLLDRHILPTFGETALGDLALSDLRTWNTRLAKEHATTAAKAYRLLATVLKTAVEDEVLLHAFGIPPGVQRHSRSVLRHSAGCGDLLRLAATSASLLTGMRPSET
jgi:hypothetical protein